MLNEKPHVLVLAGLDPSGGAGIQADIQAITALGCHPLPVLTCLTVQDTHNVYGAEPVDADLIHRQLLRLEGDTPIHAVKTGALGGESVIQVLTEFLDNREPIPYVLDPVIKAAGGGELADEKLVEAMLDQLFPLASVVTPNGPELEQLGGSPDETTSARTLLSYGCGAVLATGGHGTGEFIENRLFRADGQDRSWQQERIGGEYHGSGCTLAAGISAGMARGQALETAIETGQDFVADSIRSALRVGGGQPVPDRSHHHG